MNIVVGGPTGRSNYAFWRVSILGGKKSVLAQIIQSVCPHFFRQIQPETWVQWGLGGVTWNVMWKKIPY